MACNLSKLLVGRLRQAVVNDGKETLDKSMNPGNRRRGLHTVLTAAEATPLNNGIKFAAENGFAAEVFTLKSSLRKTAADGRPSYANSTPSDTAIRTYCAQNRDLT